MGTEEEHHRYSLKISDSAAIDADNVGTIIV